MATALHGGPRSASPRSTPRTAPLPAAAGSRGTTGERGGAAPVEATPDAQLRILSRRILALMLVSAAAGWLAATAVRVWVGNPGSALAMPAPQRTAGAVAAWIGGTGPVGLMIAANLALGLWLVRGLRRDVESVGSDLATGRRLSRLLQIRTRERDRALRAKSDLARELQHDTLTQLASRAAFLRRLDAALQRRAETGGALALFFIDVDDFKAVNDRHGHAVGDALLTAFATRLAGKVRAGDLAARLSGDEFAVLLDGLSAAQAEPVAQALVQCLSRPYGLGNEGLEVSASIGVAAFPEDGQSAAQLLQAADAAMYVAKAGGKGAFRRSGWSDLGHPMAPSMARWTAQARTR